MATKQLEVTKWLEEVLGESGEVPQYVKNECNINKLYKLMTAYKKSMIDMNHVTSYFKKSSAEYQNDGEQLASDLKEIKLTSSLLDAEDQLCVNSLGLLHSNLNLKTVSASNILLALNSLEEDYIKVQESLNSETQLTDNLIQLTRNVAEDLEKLKKIETDAQRMADIREQERNKEENLSSFNKEKVKKYHSDIKGCETKLRSVGFEESISLSSISKRMEEFIKTEKELEDKEKTLASYTLPPDMALAEVEVQELRLLLADKMKNLAQNYA